LLGYANLQIALINDDISQATTKPRFENVNYTNFLSIKDEKNTLVKTTRKCERFEKVSQTRLVGENHELGY